MNAAAVLSIFLLNAAVLLVNCNDFKVVQTDNGPLRGQKSYALYDNKPYYSFKGVPFAKPPVGNLRFKPPQALESWTDIRDALQFGNNCIQVTRFDNFKTIGDEDCLYLNVYVPETTTKNLPVMVSIHSGGYYYGSGDAYGPDFLVSNDVILVTLNYRLGILGYLSLGTPEYPGNMGMKDQQAALKWVNRNIGKFGGDVSRITLFGESAGATSTHLHLVSPTSKGLFQRVILESGSALTTWTYSPRRNYLSDLQEIAQQFGHRVDNNDQLMKFYYNVDPEMLVRETNKQFYVDGDYRRINNMLWQPLVEVSSSQQPFLSRYPEESLQEPLLDKIDMLVGHTSAEMYFATVRELHNPDMLKPLDETFQIQLPWPAIKTDFNSKVYKEISKEIRNFYFPNGARIDGTTLKEYSNLVDDLFFTYPQFKAATLDAKRAKNSNVYYYIFDIETELNHLRKLTDVAKLNLSGASHLEDLFYIFRLNDPHDPYFNYPYEELPINSIEVQKIREMSKIWTDFAKFGHPTPDNRDSFKPFKAPKFNYVKFTNNGLQSGSYPLEERMKFWDNLYNKYKNSLESLIPTNYAHSEL